MNWFRIITEPNELDLLWERLLLLGHQPLYSIEENGSTTLFVLSQGPLPNNLNAEAVPPQTTDWELEWQRHAPHQTENGVVIPLADYGAKDNRYIKMLAGAGFGDLSHPTTRMMLKLMIPLTQGKIVVDIGCGSGILAIAAAALGASLVYAIDIDPKAIEHTLKNAANNGVQIKTGLPQTFDTAPLFLMNMIRSEQELAWIHAKKGTLITSGILAEEKETALNLYRNWGWTPAGIIEEDGWLGFHLI